MMKVEEKNFFDLRSVKKSQKIWRGEVRTLLLKIGLVLMGLFLPLFLPYQEILVPFTLEKSLWNFKFIGQPFVLAIMIAVAFFLWNVLFTYLFFRGYQSYGVVNAKYMRFHVKAILKNTLKSFFLFLSCFFFMYFFFVPLLLIILLISLFLKLLIMNRSRFPFPRFEGRNPSWNAKIEEIATQIDEIKTSNIEIIQASIGTDLVGAFSIKNKIAITDTLLEKYRHHRLHRGHWLVQIIHVHRLETA